MTSLAIWPTLPAALVFEIIVVVFVPTSQSLVIFNVFLYQLVDL